jgi:hypothetical protein
MGPLLRSGAVALVLLALAALGLTAAAAPGVGVAGREAIGAWFAIAPAARFNHDLHVGPLELDCRDCHVASGRVEAGAGAPTATCAICHWDADIRAPRAAPTPAPRGLGASLRRLRGELFVPTTHAAPALACTGCHGT